MNKFQQKPPKSRLQQTQSDQRCRYSRKSQKAKPGAQILICDETQKHIENKYKKTFFIKRFFKNNRKVEIPTKFIPSSMLNLNVNFAWNGSMYVITFKKPLEAEMQKAQVKPHASTEQVSA